jgi:hypothetical protein
VPKLDGQSRGDPIPADLSPHSTAIRAAVTPQGNCPIALGLTLPQTINLSRDMTFMSRMSKLIQYALAFALLTPNFAISAQPNALQQDLIKQLVTAKVAITTGISLTDLVTQERQIQVSAELASQALSNGQRHLIDDITTTIEGIRSAWAITEDDCHRAIEDPRMVILRSPYLEDLAKEGKSSSICAKPERNNLLRQQFEKLGVEKQFDTVADKRALARTELFQPLFGVCLIRIQRAIDALQ